MINITHEIQFFEVDIANGCKTVADFCSTANLAFEASFAELEARARSARARDEELGGAMPEDFPSEHYEEFPIACDLGSAQQARDLLGPLSLVYLASLVEGFLGNVAECCDWKVNQGAGSNLWKYVSAIQTNGNFKINDGPVTIEYLEELFLARNAVVHTRRAFEIYLRSTAHPRYVNHDRTSVAFTTEDSAEAAEKLPQLAKFVTSNCLLFSKPFP